MAKSFSAEASRTLGDLGLYIVDPGKLRFDQRRLEIDILPKEFEAKSKNGRVKGPVCVFYDDDLISQTLDLGYDDQCVVMADRKDALHGLIELSGVELAFPQITDLIVAREALESKHRVQILPSGRRISCKFGSSVVGLGYDFQRRKYNISQTNTGVLVPFILPG